MPKKTRTSRRKPKRKKPQRRRSNPFHENMALVAARYRELLLVYGSNLAGLRRSEKYGVHDWLRAVLACEDNMRDLQRGARNDKASGVCVFSCCVDMCAHALIALAFFEAQGRPDPDDAWVAGRVVKLLEDTKSMHDRKRKDYGKDSDSFANVRASSGFGVRPWVGALIRANDKLARLQTYAIKRELANESVTDSMIDLAVYSVIALCLYQETAAQSR